MRFFKFCFLQKVVLQQKFWLSYVTYSNLIATRFFLGFLHYITINIDKVSVKSLLQSLCFFLGWCEENVFTTILSQWFALCFFSVRRVRMVLPFLFTNRMRFYNFLLQSSFSSFSLRLDKMSSGRRLGSIGCPNEVFFPFFFSSKIGYDVSVGLCQNGAHRKHGVLTCVWWGCSSHEVQQLYRQSSMWFYFKFQVTS